MISKQKFLSALAQLCLGVLPIRALAQAPAQSLGIMDQREIQRILAGGQAYPGGGNGVLLDLNFMRLQSTSLNDPAFFKYFVALNNCSNPQITSLLKSEFDFPKIAAFYKERAPTILSAVPTTLRVQIGKLSPGEYDSARKAFPIKYQGRTHPGQPPPQGFTIDHVDPVPERTALLVCKPASSLLASIGGREGPPVYEIKFDRLQFTEVPMDEAKARNWILTTPVRQLTLIMDIDILPNAPAVLTAQGRPLGVVFDGQVKRVAALGMKPLRTASAAETDSQQSPQELSVLYP